MVSIKNRCIWKKQVWASDSCETFFSGFHNIKKDQQQKLSFNFRFQGRPSSVTQVTSCWVPPVEARRKETAWVKWGASRGSSNVGDWVVFVLGCGLKSLKNPPDLIDMIDLKMIELGKLQHLFKFEKRP